MDNQLNLVDLVAGYQAYTGDLAVLRRAVTVGRGSAGEVAGALGFS